MRLTAVNITTFARRAVLGTAGAAFRRGQNGRVETGHSIPINPAAWPTTKR